MDSLSGSDMSEPSTSTPQIPNDRVTCYFCTNTTIDQLSLEEHPMLKNFYMHYKRCTAVKKPETLQEYYRTFNPIEEDIQSEPLDLSTPRLHFHNEEQSQTVPYTIDGNETVSPLEPNLSQYGIYLDNLMNETMCSCGCELTLQDALSQKEKGWSQFKKNNNVVVKHSWWITTLFKRAIEGTFEQSNNLDISLSNNLDISLSEDDIPVGMEITLNEQGNIIDHENID